MAERRHKPVGGRVQGFLDSQRGLASFYATEGKQMAAAWTNQGIGDSRPQSPMLVPRAAAAMDDGDRATTVDSPLNKCEEPPQQSSHSTSELSPPLKQSTHSKITSPRQIKSGISGRAQLKTVDRDLTPHDESERAKRLEQRRNRRRARRDAMAASDEVSIPEAASSQGDIDQPKKKRHKNESKSKSKKAKATPALLLMQTFSGQTMGRSRLTIKPSASVGVFNKGKASAKVPTKNSQTGRPDIAFSESAFLSKTRPTQESGILSDDSDDSEAHSDHSLKERVSRRNLQTTPKPTPSYKQPVDDETGSKSSSSAGSVRETSPPWDVETQPAHLHSADAARSGLISLPPASKPKTAVVGVNQCSWSSKLRKAKTNVALIQDASLLPPLPKPSEKQQNITSSYFRSTEVSVEPPASLSPLPEERANLAGVEDVCSPILSQNGGLVEPLDYEVALSLPDVSSDYMHTSHALALTDGLPINSMEFPSYELYETDLLDTGGTLCNWQSQEPDSGYSEVLHPSRAETMHPLDMNGELRAYEDSRFEYDTIQDEIDDLYDDQECILYGEADGYYDDMDEPLYRFLNDTSDQQEHFEDFGTGYEQGTGYETGEKLADVNGEDDICWETFEEHNQPDDVFDYLPDELDFDDHASLGGGIIIEDHVEEAAPRLVQVITETSLEKDLLKSIGNHWGTAHRLY